MWEQADGARRVDDMDVFATFPNENWNQWLMDSRSTIRRMEEINNKCVCICVHISYIYVY